MRNGIWLWSILMMILCMPINASCTEEKSLLAVNKLNSVQLSNNVLKLRIEEKKSSEWRYKYNKKDWGESCYNEFFVVYINGKPIKSDEFTITTPFPSRNDGPGSVKAVLQYGAIEVSRAVGLSAGNTRYFKIMYQIKNTGQSTISDVRFFQIVDFDIPKYSDRVDDKAWYTQNNDYIGVSDDNFFKNIMVSVPKSTKHSVGTWSVVVNDDWKDGILNGSNTAGDADVAIAKQFNLGDIPSNGKKSVTITVWFGDPITEEQIKISKIFYPENNKKAHHTDKYPKGLNVFRRAQGFNVEVDFTGIYEEDLHTLEFKVQTPSTSTNTSFPIEKWSSSSSKNKWTVKSTNIGCYEIFIPNNAAVGKHKLTAQLCKKNGNDSSVVDSKDGDAFYVIFNPWAKDDGIKVDKYEKTSSPKLE
ncbi:MAG: hypothetical protein QME49_09545 [bacterium]|nr:hypothetical protein [bacterium]